MKKQILFLSAIALLAFNSSCNKDDNNPNPNPNPTNPNPTNPTTSTPKPTTPVINGVSGTLVSVIMEYSYTNPYVSTPVTMQYDVAVAAFPAANGSDLLPAGTVSVNSHELEKADNNAYYVVAVPGTTPSSLDFSGGSSNWSIGGAGSISAFTYNHDVSFPDYTGTLPSSVSKSSGVTIDLDGVSNADSVYLVIAAGNQFIQTAVGGDATSISFTAAEMQNLPVVSDNSALIQVVPFRITLETHNGNQYAYIKQRAAISAINID